jgi:hypothetical protein
MLRRLLCLAALVLAAPAAAASSPPLFTAPDKTVLENAGSVGVDVLKSAKTTSYSKIRIRTMDGSCKANVNYRPVDVTLTFGNTALKMTVPVGLIDNSAYGGACTFAVTLTPVRFAQVPGGYNPTTITVQDNEIAPPPPPTPATLWIASTFRPGGFARCKLTVCVGNRPARDAVQGEIVNLIASGWSAGIFPPGGTGVKMWAAWPTNGETQALAGLRETDLEAVAPAPGTQPPAQPARSYSISTIATAKTDCPGLNGTPGSVRAGVRYRVWLEVGGLLPPWPLGNPGMIAVPEADPYFGPVALVATSCLTPSP